MDTPRPIGLPHQFAASRGPHRPADPLAQQAREYAIRVAGMPVRKCCRCRLETYWLHEGRLCGACWAEQPGERPADYRARAIANCKLTIAN